MTTRAYDTLVPSLAVSVPGCPDFLILQEIQRAAVEVCERTLAWRYQSSPLVLTPGVSEYFYNKPENTDVHAVFEVLMNGEPLQRLTLDTALHKFPEWVELFSGMDPADAWESANPTMGYNEAGYNDITFNGGANYVATEEALKDAMKPTSVTQLTPDKFLVLPLPDDKEEYRCLFFVALKPKRSATGMDEVLFYELQDAIMHNALHRLLVLPNTGWANGDLAMYHAKQYAYQVTQRRIRANLGNARGSMRVRMKPFVGTRQWY